MPYKDKEKQREAQKKHYLLNKEKYATSRKTNRNKRDVWFRELKSKHHCLKCGLQDLRCLDFHHRNPIDKNFAITEGVKLAFSEAKILAEIEKCDVFCSNCHLINHYNPKFERSRDHITHNATWLRNYKNGIFCAECKINNPIILCFHHKDQENKHLAIADMVSKGCSVARLLEEIDKCEVLCSNCHRIRHNGNIWEDSSYGGVA